MSEAGSSEKSGGDLCVRLLCDMRCLVAITLLFLGVFVSIVVVGVTQGVARDVNEDLSLVLIDTDMGIDDVYALSMLLEGEKRYYDPQTGTGPKVIGITCMSGNTHVDHVVVNVLKVLNIMNRLDGSIPVYRGASKSIMKSNSFDSFFGEDGMGDVAGVPSPSLDHLNSTHAAVAMVDLVNRYPGQITLLAIGPLTNIALAIRLDEDFLTKLKHLFIMGGAMRGRGNIAPGAEFNLWADPEAAYIVLRDAQYDNDTITMLPWEEVVDLHLTWAWRSEVLGPISTPVMDLLNAAERVISAYPEWDMADPLAAALLLRPGLALRTEKHAVIPFTQGDARGVIGVDYLNSMRNASRVLILGNINVDTYKSMLVDFMSSP